MTNVSLSNCDIMDARPRLMPCKHDLTFIWSYLDQGVLLEGRNVVPVPSLLLRLARCACERCSATCTKCRLGLARRPPLSPPPPQAHVVISTISIHPHLEQRSCTVIKSRAQPLTSHWASHFSTLYL